MSGTGHTARTIHYPANTMVGLTFLMISLIMALLIFGIPPLMPSLDRLHRRLSADLQRQFHEGAAARGAEAPVEEQREAIRRLVADELAKLDRTNTVRRRSSGSD